MNLELWQELVASHRESVELVTQAAPEAAANDLDAMRVIIGAEAMEALHGQLRQTLGRLAAKLGQSLDSGDIKQLLFVIAIALDEKVQRRLPPEEAPRWPLLQRALFDVHDGGEMFYDLIDDRLARRDSLELQLVLEVCYFCLSDGFVGRHSRNRPMIEEYKRKLAARIARPSAQDSEERTMAFLGPVKKQRPRRRYWLAAAGVLVLLPLLFLLAW